tara:strand:- start:1367 stop:1531 length:165 start_codon:yes stop_codon:yes gene_type:complete
MTASQRAVLNRGPYLGVQGARLHNFVKQKQLQLELTLPGPASAIIPISISKLII